MSSRFHVDPNERVDVYEFEPTGEQGATTPNVITVRARMNVEIAGRVQGEMAKRNAASQTVGHIGVVAVALFLHNILDWRGPDFDDLPCTPENIRALPPPELDPFIEKVLNRLGELNERRVAPNPKFPTANGSGINGSHDASPQSAPGISLQLATSTPRSDSRSVLAGHLRRSASSTPTTSQNSLDD